MSGGPNKQLNELFEDELASSRLRLLPAGRAAVSMGWTVSVGDHAPNQSSVILIGKIPIFDYEKRAPHWLGQLKELARRNGRIIVDYTDHHLGFDSPIKSFYTNALGMADLCTVSHEVLARALCDAGGIKADTIRVVEDAIEYDVVTPRQRPKSAHASGVLWFGHGTNFEFLARLCADWPKAAPRDLYIVSSQEVHEFIRNGHLDASVPLQIHFRQWSPPALSEVAAAADIAVIPSSFDSRKQFASSNRLVTGLALGLPVVATPLPSYTEFQNYFFELGSAEANAAFANPRLGHDKVFQFQEKFAARFSLSAIQQNWQAVINAI
jgi:hypothetical protein